MKRAGIVAAMALTVCALTGCTAFWVTGGIAVATLVSGSAVGYHMSAVRETIGAPLPDVRDAAVVTLQELGDRVVEDTGDAASAEIKGRFADGTTVEIYLSAYSETATRVGIRVGVAGNRSRGQWLLREIVSRISSRRAAGASSPATPAPAP